MLRILSIAGRELDNLACPFHKWLTIFLLRVEGRSLFG